MNNNEEFWAAMIMGWVREMGCKDVECSETFFGVRVDFNFRNKAVVALYERKELIIVMRPYNDYSHVSDPKPPWSVRVPTSTLDFTDPNKSIRESFKEAEELLKRSLPPEH